ncbi:MAG: beta-N-acetylhexosaminidase [bacterium]
MHDQLILSGQLLAVGFDGVTAPPGLLRRISTGRVGAVILFARNVEGPAQLATLCAALSAAAPAGRPLLIAIDQEGGRVRRLREPWPDWPSARRLGDTGDPELVTRVGAAMGRELASCGIHCNLAPVLDVHTNPDNPVIGDRAFATTPDGVARFAGAYAAGLESAGVASCGKHFPGHGDTSQDSHTELPFVRHGTERLEAVELAPFAALAQTLPAMMSAHVVFEAWDPERPATLSPAALQGRLRGLGFSGVILSDDMEMRAVADLHGPEELAVMALQAGVDLIAACHDTARQERMLAALAQRAEGDHDFARRVAAAAARVAQLKQRYCTGKPPDPAAAKRVAADPEHHRLAASLAP